MEIRAALDSKPTATAKSVEDLVRLISKGNIRIPSFQRGLRWDASDVRLLFDSIYRGYPVGSLLFLQKPARADRLQMGPLTIDAAELSEALWVVDGQQRLTALAATLTRPEPFPASPIDAFVIYFDPRNRTFEKPPQSGGVPSHWVPASLLLDSSRLTEWVFGWVHGSEEPLRRAVFEAGKRVREYSLPMYVIETADEQVPKEIFDRANTAGKPMLWTDVHKALFGSAQGHPASLQDLAEDLDGVGMGKFDENRLLSCLVAMRGLDVTRNPGEHFRLRPELMRTAVADVAPVLRRVLSFLRADAHIPHLELLPESSVLDVLTRFFQLHKDPSPRVRTLLARWVWRIFFGAGLVARATLRRRGVAEISPENEEDAVQYLLSLVGRNQPPYHSFPDRFDARAAQSRIVLLAICSRSPRHLETGTNIDIAELMVEKGKGIQTFVKVKEVGNIARSAANRTLHPHGTNLRSQLCKRFEAHGLDAVIQSHSIDDLAMDALIRGDASQFLLRRMEILIGEVGHLSQRLAGWGRTDRPSISHLLATAQAS